MYSMIVYTYNIVFAWYATNNILLTVYRFFDGLCLETKQTNQLSKSLITMMQFYIISPDEIVATDLLLQHLWFLDNKITPKKWDDIFNHIIIMYAWRYFLRTWILKSCGLQSFALKALFYANISISIIKSVHKY